MTSLRETVHIDRSPDDVWAVVGDAAGIAGWFPSIESATVAEGTRTIVVMGLPVEEEIVTHDDELRRFQYRIQPGTLPVEFHLGTVDVLPDGDGSLVIYSTNIVPDDLAPLIGPGVADAVKELKAQLEA